MRESVSIGAEELTLNGLGSQWYSGACDSMQTNPSWADRSPLPAIRPSSSIRGVIWTLGGDIHGTGSLKKQGTGTLTLAGNDTYSGTTLVSGGRLLVNGSLAADMQ